MVGLVTSEEWRNVVGGNKEECHSSKKALNGGDVCLFGEMMSVLQSVALHQDMDIDPYHKEVQ